MHSHPGRNNLLQGAQPETWGSAPPADPAPAWRGQRAQKGLPLCLLHRPQLTEPELGPEPPGPAVLLLSLPGLAGCGVVRDSVAASPLKSSLDRVWRLQERRLVMMNRSPDRGRDMSKVT